MSRATKRNPIDPLTKARLQWTALSDLATERGDTIILERISKWYRFVKMRPDTIGAKKAFKELDAYFNIITKEVDQHLKGV
jgi:hypothetical protein